MERGLIENILDVARKNVLNYGELIPTLFLLNKGRIKSIVEIKLPKEEGNKRRLMYGIGKEMKRIEVDEVIFVSEGWMVATEKMPGLPPSQHPDRRECLFLVYGKKGSYKLRSFLKHMTPEGPMFEELTVKKIERTDSPLLDMFWEGYERG